MTELTPFGVELRKLRLEKSLRLLDLARKLKVSAAYISAIETGKKPIPERFVVEISKALNLVAVEISKLHKAADRTRKEVRLEGKKAEDRELISAFARRLDDIPSSVREELWKYLKSLAGETPFARRRRGIIVPPRSTKDLRHIAETIRSASAPDARIDFPIIEFLELKMPILDPTFVFDVQSAEEMGDNEGLVPIGENRLILREDVYERACDNSTRDRFTACHEFGHYLLHRRIKFARARDDGDKIFLDSEWQADTFAGTLLISQRHLKHFRDEIDAAEQCKVSAQAASVMWKKYQEEGAISRAA